MSVTLDYHHTIIYADAQLLVTLDEASQGVCAVKRVRAHENANKDSLAYRA